MTATSAPNATKEPVATSTAFASSLSLLAPPFDDPAAWGALDEAACALLVGCGSATLGVGGTALAAADAGAAGFALAAAPLEGASGDDRPHPRTSMLVDSTKRRIYPRLRVAFDPSCVGFVTEPASFSYDGDTLALYALGIGATRDELDHLYEGRGPKAFPTFAVIPAQPSVFACLERTGGDFESVVHGAQSVRVVRPFPSQGKVETTATISGLYDLKRLVSCVVRTETRLAGELLAETEWTIFYRTGGGFGGAPPPKRSEPKIPDTAPDAEVVQKTSPEQALLYRLSGDKNPLHADPDLAAKVGFADGPILHGLCTYGFAFRAGVGAFASGDASRVVRYDAQFKKPVWPGDTLTTSFHRVEDRRIVLASKARDTVVMTGFLDLSA